jgi:hypothetical protein
MLILSLVLVPTKTHTTTLDLFLTFLTQRKFSRHYSSDLVLLIKFYFYLFTTPQNQNLTTFFCLPQKFNNLASLSSLKNLLPFLSSSQISSSSPHLLASLKSPCQSPYRNIIKRALQKISLSYTYCLPSHKLSHQLFFVITCKATKHTKNRNILEADFSTSLKHCVAISSAINLS